MRVNQEGQFHFPGDFSDLSFDAEISFNDRWYSLNDHVSYVVGSESFGVTAQTYRRNEISSAFFKGSYPVSVVPDNTKRTAEVYVYGQTYAGMKVAQQKLIRWFSQPSYLIRILRDDSLETMRCDQADYQIEETHVFSHNRMCKVTFSLSVDPDVTFEMVV